MRIRRNESHEELEARLNSLHRVPEQGGLTEYEKIEARKAEYEKMKAQEEKQKNQKQINSYKPWGKKEWDTFIGICGFILLFFALIFSMATDSDSVKTTDELRRERWEYEMEQDRIENQRIQEERAYKDLKSMTK